MEITTSISVSRLQQMAEAMYGEMVKGVVDVERRLLAVDAEMHVDEEQLLLEDGSKQGDLWGINLYPESYASADFVEFDSMVNIRPAQGNRSRSVEDPAIQRLILEIVGEIVHA